MITKPGFYKLRLQDYLADPALNRSKLVLFDKSGKHLQIGSKETHPMRFGTAWHWINLEPKKFAKRIKKKKSGYSERRGEDLYFKTEDIQTLKEMKKIFWQKKTTKKLFRNAYAKELSGFWELWTGQMAKIRLDMITKDEHGPLVVDLKKCKCAAKDIFWWDIKKHKYHWQAALSLEGVSKITGIEHYRFVLMCTEDTPPYETGFYQISDEWIELAWREMQPLIDKYAICKEQNKWDGYPDEFINLNLRRGSYGS